MPTTKYIVALEKSERELLKKIIKKGSSPAKVISRAHTLLMADNKSKTNQEIANILHITARTVYNIRRRYITEGIERALYDAPRPGQPIKITAKDEAHVIALACTNPPKGYNKWTLDLLIKKAKRKGKEIKRTTMYNILLRNELKPWREKNVVRS